jgi:hypothetical protein
VKDVRKVVVPEWGPFFENEPEIQDYGHSLIEMIMAKGSKAERSYQCIRKTCIGTEGDER